MANSGILGFDAIQWLQFVAVPLLIALPPSLIAIKTLRENRSQHGSNGDKLDVVAEEVRNVRGELTGVREDVTEVRSEVARVDQKITDHVAWEEQSKYDAVDQILAHLQELEQRTKSLHLPHEEAGQ